MQQEISMFGPKGSGKTGVLKAFLHLVIRKRFKDDNATRLDQTTTLIPYIIEGPNITAFGSPEKPVKTPDQERIRVQITRMPEKDYERNYRAQLCTHVYNIDLWDDKGALFEAIQLDWPKTMQEHPEAQIAWDKLRDSAAIIVILDPTLINDGPYHGYAPIDESNSVPGFTKEQYRQTLVHLNEWLNNDDREVAHPRKLAICVTKADIAKRLYNHVDNPRTLIKNIFGPLMLEVIDAMGEHHTVREFGVSTLGMHIGESNFDPNTGWLKEKEEWEPTNIHKPFFWIFDELKRDAISDSVNRVSRWNPLGWHITRTRLSYLNTDDLNLITFLNDKAAL